MQNEALKKIAVLLSSFNNTFELEAKRVNSEDDSAEVTISNIRNNGSDFIKELHDTFNAIVEASSEEHEVMYIEGKGIVLAKKVIKYVIEDFS